LGNNHVDGYLLNDIEKTKLNHFVHGSDKLDSYNTPSFIRLPLIASSRLLDNQNTAIIAF
jgi:hypothetical protein